MSLDQAFTALKTYDWGSDRNALNPIEDAAVTLTGNDREKLEQMLREVLTSNASHAAKDYVCRKLILVGTAASVPTLAELLPNKEYSHLVRGVLERIPASEASQALRDAAGKLDGALQVGVIASLGVREDAASIPAIAAQLTNSDRQVASAAAHALGDIQTPEAAKALSAASTKDDEVLAAICDAKLACGEALLADGKKVEALAIYKSMAGENQPKHIKLAATRGMLACTGK